jgi:excisionase family DNA binding protein
MEVKTSTKARTTGRADTEQERPALDCKTYSIQEAGELLGIGRSLAYELAQEGTLPGVRRLGRRYVVSRAALDAWLEIPKCLMGDG